MKQTPVPASSNKTRATYNRYQREFLNAVFERVHYPSRVQRDAISACLGGAVNQNQIKVWFQNARRRAVLRGAKFDQKRPDSSASSTPMPPPQNTGPAAQMVNTYFNTIRQYVDQIADLGGKSSNNEAPTSPKTVHQPKRTKRSLQRSDSVEEETVKRSRGSSSDDGPLDLNITSESSTRHDDDRPDSGFNISPADASRSSMPSRASSGVASRLSSCSQISPTNQISPLCNQFTVNTQYVQQQQQCFVPVDFRSSCSYSDPEAANAWYQSYHEASQPSAYCENQ